jgi:sugar phosphate isomerase/epimerase
MTRYSRREFGRLAMAALPATGLLARAMPAFAQAKPNSVFGGVQIGVLAPFNFRTEAPDVESILKAMVRLGSNSVEMQNDAPEAFAGAPKLLVGIPTTGRVPPETAAALERFGHELSTWRATVPMTRFEEIRRMYSAAGVRIDAYRIQLAGPMPDGAFDYAFNAARALGANQVTMQLPMVDGSLTNQDLALTARVAKFAEKHKIPVGFHQELQPPSALWDAALAQSPQIRIQVDIGNFVAAHKDGDSPLPFIEKHHDRIVSIHLKDRKRAGAGSFVFGEGETPVREVLQLMKRNKYTFPAFIELGYPIPEGSTRIDETARCLAFAKATLA